MKLDVEVGLGPGHIVLDGGPASNIQHLTNSSVIQTDRDN